MGDQIKPTRKDADQDHAEQPIRHGEQPIGYGTQSGWAEKIGIMAAQIAMAQHEFGALHMRLNDFDGPSRSYQSKPKKSKPKRDRTAIKAARKQSVKARKK